MAAPPKRKASSFAHAKQRSCVGKMRYGERRARRAARILRDRGDPTHAYACEHCGRWHVGETWSLS